MQPGKAPTGTWHPFHPATACWTQHTVSLWFHPSQQPPLCCRCRIQPCPNMSDVQYHQLSRSCHLSGVLQQWPSVPHLPWTAHSHLQQVPPHLQRSVNPPWPSQGRLTHQTSLCHRHLPEWQCSNHFPVYRHIMQLQSRSLPFRHRCSDGRRIMS